MTTSKSEAARVLSGERSLFCQRLSGAPLTNMALPLSARMIPYFFSAVRITWFWAEKPEISKPAFRRMRMPMGGALGSVTEEAQCEAGEVKACRVVGMVKRNAC